MVLRKMRDGFDDEAIGTVTGFQNRPHFSALEDGFERVHLEMGLGLVAAVAFDVGGVKNWFNVSGIGHAGFGGGRRQRGVLRRCADGGRKIHGQDNDDEVGGFHWSVRQ